jgi:hypothetical protein
VSHGCVISPPIAHRGAGIAAPAETHTCGGPSRRLEVQVGAVPTLWPIHLTGVKSWDGWSSCRSALPEVYG